jgi:hypothetical protein
MPNAGGGGGASGAGTTLAGTTSPGHGGYWSSAYNIYGWVSATAGTLGAGGGGSPEGPTSTYPAGNGGDGFVILYTYIP